MLFAPVPSKFYSECLTKEDVEGFGDFKIGGKVIRTVNYADDLVLLAQEEPVLQGMMESKVLPRTAHEGPEGEQMYSSTLPSTSVLDGGGWSTPRPGRFTPGKDSVPIV